MNRATFVFGLVMLTVGVVALVWRFQDPSLREAIAAIKGSDGNETAAVTRFTVGVVLPAVLPFAIGIAFLVLGLMGRAPSWLGR